MDGTGMFHDQFEAILENDCMCHASGPSLDEMACKPRLFWRCGLNYCMYEMSLSCCEKSSGGKVTC